MNIMSRSFVGRQVVICPSLPECHQEEQPCENPAALSRQLAGRSRQSRPVWMGLVKCTKRCRDKRLNMVKVHRCQGYVAGRGEDSISGKRLEIVCTHTHTQTWSNFPRYWECLRLKAAAVELSSAAADAESRSPIRSEEAKGYKHIRAERCRSRLAAESQKWHCSLVQTVQSAAALQALCFF